MSIRRGNPSDCDAVAALIASFQPLLTRDPGGAGAEQYLASVSASAERQYVASSRYMYLVYEHEGDIAGFIAMRDRTHLFHLFVAAPHQHRGIARALWHEARDWAHQGAAACEFTVNSSLNAVRVYERFGFVAVGTALEAHGIAFQPMRLTSQREN